MEELPALLQTIKAVLWRARRDTQAVALRRAELQRAREETAQALAAWQAAAAAAAAAEAPQHQQQPPPPRTAGPPCRGASSFGCL